MYLYIFKYIYISNYICDHKSPTHANDARVLYSTARFLKTVDMSVGVVGGGGV